MADTIRLIFKTHAVSEVKDIFDDFEDTMKAFKVTCAIIEQDGKILAARRGERMRLPLKWEFPGGKLHEGESPRECLKREIQEEMGISIEILSELPASRYQYEDLAIVLLPFICRRSHGELLLREHKEIVWGKPEDLMTLDWAPADIPVLQSYLHFLSGKN